MANYIDGLIVPVPKKKLQSYRRLAQKAGKIWREYGALDYRECVADDVAPTMDPKTMPFDGKRMIYGGFTTLVEA
jgi:uncharacterized protein YbaA (DUF1428 family)